MTCDELRDSYELAAMGALEGPERGELAEHLGRDCPACTSGMRAARDWAAAMSGVVPLADPPRRLRRRVLSSVGVETPGWGWMAWASAAACLLVAVLWLSLEDRRVSGELAQTRRELLVTGGRLGQVQQVLEFLNDPETKQVSFGKAEQQPPRGNVLIHARRGVMLIASNLPPAPAGKTYEMWVVPKGGAPRPAGTFDSDAGGNARHLLAGPLDRAATAAIAVSLEPAGGSETPTQVLFAAPLPAAD